jgi:hypothetical protein
VREHANEKSKEKEKIMNSYYSYIGSSHIDNIISDLDKIEEDIQGLNFPDKLNQWFSNYIEIGKKRESSIKFKKDVKRILSRVAIFILIVFSSITILTISVEAFRVKVFNFFIDVNETHTEIRVEEDTKDNERNKPIWKDYYFPSYLPENFEVTNTDIFNETRVAHFSDSIHFITFSQAPKGTDFQIDTEGSVITEVEINGHKGILATKDSLNILFWSNDTSSFCLTTNLETEKMVKIAKNIKK